MKQIVARIHCTAITDLGYTPHPPAIEKFWLEHCSCMYVHMLMYVCMCHGAGAKVRWIKEYRGLTFTM